MIREIFLPERIGSRRIIAQKIVSIALYDDAVFAVKLYAKSSQTVIEKMMSESFEPGNQESMVQALLALRSKLDHYDRIIVTLPASLVVIKELEVPFIDADKIRMVLNYEIEPMLPFGIDEAVIDFMVTEFSVGQGTSHILAAAVRMQDLQNMLELYKRAGIEPSTVTVDLFALYGLYQQIVDYQTLKNATALVDLGLYTTRISFLQHGKMRMTRQIPRGLMTMVSAIAKESAQDPDQILSDLCSQGIIAENSDNKAIHKQVVNFFNDIQFTLNSFSLKANYYEGISKILFTGKAVVINNFMKFSSDVLQIPCEIFDPKKIMVNKHIINKVTQEPKNWSVYAVALGAGIPSPMLLDFNLCRGNVTVKNQQTLVRQIIAAGILMVVIVTTVGLNGFLQLHKLQDQADIIEKKQLKRFASLVGKQDKTKKVTFQSVVNKAKNSLKEKAELWLPVTQKHTNPLELLLELTELIDKKKFSISVEEVVIVDQGQDGATIEIEGYFQADRDKWASWAEVEKRFKESVFLELFKDSKGAEEMNSSDAAEKGIKFKAKFKQKDSSDREV